MQLLHLRFFYRCRRCEMQNNLQETFERYEQLLKQLEENRNTRRINLDNDDMLLEKNMLIFLGSFLRDIIDSNITLKKLQDTSDNPSKNIAEKLRSFLEKQTLNAEQKQLIAQDLAHKEFIYVSIVINKLTHLETSKDAKAELTIDDFLTRKFLMPPTPKLQRHTKQ